MSICLQFFSQDTYAIHFAELENIEVAMLIFIYSLFPLLMTKSPPNTHLIQLKKSYIIYIWNRNILHCWLTLRRDSLGSPPLQQDSQRQVFTQMGVILQGIAVHSSAGSVTVLSQLILWVHSQTLYYNLRAPLYKCRTRILNYVVSMKVRSWTERLSMG